MEDCFQEVFRSSLMTYHFARKGTTLEGLVTTKCGFDDRYYRVQCPDSVCTCHGPDGSLIGSYRVESKYSGTIDCRCALEEYLAKQQRQPFDVLRCDGAGNFEPIQCYSNDQICYCTDRNGVRISERFTIKTINNFIQKYAPSYNVKQLCRAMQSSLNHFDLIQKDQEFYFEPTMQNYRIRDDRPDPMKIIPHAFLTRPI